MTLTARAASPADAEAIATIYNEGIADRIGTFETEPRSAEQIAAWFDGRHPIVVVEEGREVVAFASTSAYRARPCYAGIAEFSVYVARNRRGAGAGRVAMDGAARGGSRSRLSGNCSRAFSPKTRRAGLLWRNSVFAKSAFISGTASSMAPGGIV